MRATVCEVGHLGAANGDECHTENPSYLKLVNLSPPRIYPRNSLTFATSLRVLSVGHITYIGIDARA